MRRRHFEALRPLCPVCRADGGRDSPLRLVRVLTEEGEPGEQGGEHVVEGLIQCSHAGCLREYPVIDGVPLLVPRIRAWLEANALQVLARDDLTAETESLLGDALGPGSAFEVLRQQVASYAWDHWADRDPEETAADPTLAAPRTDAAPSADRAPGAAVRLLDRGLDLVREGASPAGPVLDLGCAVGRTTFELAERRPDELVLGVDLHFAMLRLAARVLRAGVARWDRRRVGLVYDRRQMEVELPQRENVDFWACDATALPFPEGTFGLAASLNVLDCVASPRDALGSLAQVLRPGGRAVVATPYDWSPAATPVEAWLGGHSQRGPHRGAAEPVLRALLTPGAHPAAVEGLEILAEDDAVPWRVRLHDRGAMEYRVHLLALGRRKHENKQK